MNSYGFSFTTSTLLVLDSFDNRVNLYADKLFHWLRAVASIDPSDRFILFCNSAINCLQILASSCKPRVWDSWWLSKWASICSRLTATIVLPWRFSGSILLSYIFFRVEYKLRFEHFGIKTLCCMLNQATSCSQSGHSTSPSSSSSARNSSRLQSPIVSS